MLGDQPITYRRKKQMKKGIIGKKIGMTQIFDDKGKSFPSRCSRQVPAW